MRGKIFRIDDVKWEILPPADIFIEHEVIHQCFDAEVSLQMTALINDDIDDFLLQKRDIGSDQIMTDDVEIRENLLESCGDLMGQGIGNVECIRVVFFDFPSDVFRHFGAGEAGWVKGQGMK